MSGLFFSDSDRTFFDSFNEELLTDIIATDVIVYKVVPDNEENQYGESINKTFFPGVEMKALISHDDQQVDYNEDLGPKITQTISIYFHRQTLKNCDLYPEIGDYIDWQGGFYEAGHRIENQLVGGYEWSVGLSAHLTKENKINIVE